MNSSTQHAGSASTLLVAAVSFSNFATLTIAD